MPAGLDGDEGVLGAMPGPRDEARCIHPLVPEEGCDPAPEIIVAGHPGEVTGKTPAGEGCKGRGHGTAALDDHVPELAFAVGVGPGGDSSDHVEGALAETVDVHHPPAVES